MSRIAVFGARGTAGGRIVTEAARRGHAVLAVGRTAPPPLGAVEGDVTAVVGDATSADSVREIADGVDAVVLAIGGPGRELYRAAADTALTVIAELAEPRARILHMGGGATLTTPDGTRFLDLPGFPPEYLDPAVGQAAALDRYLEDDGPVAWTYLSPPPVDFHPGERTGTYRTGTDQPVTDAEGTSRLSYEDFAVAVIDELERPRFLRQRFTAAY